MKIYALGGGIPTLIPCLPDAGYAVALGNFDGVHLGHAALLEAAVEYSRARTGVLSLAWTFDEAPGEAVHPNALRLTPTSMKLELLSSCGVDYAVTVDFPDIKNLTPAEFVFNELISKLHAEHIVCGFNFRFGKGGVGDASVLRELLSQRGVSLTVVSPVTADGEVVSSTAVRRLLSSGDTDGAARLLGRQYCIDFPVVEGKKLGRTIGLPTINQCFPDGYLIPAHGIYAVTCTLGADDPVLWLGAANIGVRPTVSDSGVANCETHIIGYSGDLYGRNIRVRFYKKIRDERKFASVDELREQINRDVADIKEYFSHK